MTHTDFMPAALKLLLLTTTVAAATPAFAQDVIGRNSAVKGDVTIQSIDEEVRAAVLRDEVKIGDDIEAQVDSSLQVLLLDETVFTVGPSAQVVIDRFVYDPSTANNRMSARVQQGMFRFMSGNISRQSPDQVEIGTPVASLGIRGTIVEGLVGQEAIDYARANGLIDDSQPIDPDGASIFVLRGPGSNRTGQDRRGRIEVTNPGGTASLTRPGRAVFVQHPDVPPIEFEMDEAGFELFSEKLRTRPSGRASFQPFEVEPRIRDLGEGSVDVDPFEPYDPETDLDWPETDPDFFDQPCGPTICLDDF